MCVERVERVEGGTSGVEVYEKRGAVFGVACERIKSMKLEWTIFFSVF